MSLSFLGSYTPNRPVVLTSSAYGAGTAYPIQWTRYGSTGVTADDIVRHQWRANKIDLVCNGDVTLKFYDPIGVDPPEDVTASFAMTTTVTCASTGTDASVRLPSNITTGDATQFFGNASQNVSVTTSWGPATVACGCQMSLGFANLGIESVAFLKYRKAMEVIFSAAGISAAPTNSGIQVDTIDSAYTALGEDATLLFGTAPLYYVVLSGDASVTFSEFSLTLSDELPVP